jgi:DNA adenine methylase
MVLISAKGAHPMDFMTTREAAAKPFVKWAGGKTQILDSIRLKYPSGLGKTITKYAEPFVGGGAVLFDVLNNYDLDYVYISDINRELIHTYQTIRDSVSALVIRLMEIENEYLPADERIRKDLYYLNRYKYNTLKASDDTSVELAALFIFLNRTCFNGLYRVNSKGAFNVPQGGYKNPCICDANNLWSVSEVLQNVQIVCGDYKESYAFTDSSTFVYFDPPYRPLTVSSSFTAYSQDGFDDNAQIELAAYIDNLSVCGACVVASNSDPKNTDESDDFFDSLYSRQKVSRISASRAINSNGNKRGKINELLIASY